MPMPPHFWALALFVKTDYEQAGVPMLPVVAGERVTRHQIGLYTIPMALAAVAPWPLGLTGPVYGIVASVMTAVFALLALRVATRHTGANDPMKPEKLVDFEDYFRRWRFNHVTTVERIIGLKRGTGGTSGVAYLRRMLDVVLFPELWRVRTVL